MTARRISNSQNWTEFFVDAPAAKPDADDRLPQRHQHVRGQRGPDGSRGAPSLFIGIDLDHDVLDLLRL